MKLKSYGTEETRLLSIGLLWRFKPHERFNVLCIGTLFRQSGMSLVVGGEDGIIRIYDLKHPTTTFPPTQLQLVLETKSGPIQTMAVEDVTKFYHNDLVVGDSRGMLTIFCNQQILSRQTLAKDSISALQIQTDATGNLCIVTGTETGQVNGVLPGGTLWQLNINNFHPASNRPLQMVQCMLAAELADQQGQTASYVLVSDTSKSVHVLQDGHLVCSIPVPGVVTAMAKGRFVSPSKLSWPASQNGGVFQSQQVALGTNTGAIYILQNFLVSESEFANTESPITKLVCLPQPQADLDVLLCAGFLSSLLAYLDCKLVCQYNSTDWVNTMDIGDIDGDGNTEIVIGCLDNTISALKFSSVT